MKEPFEELIDQLSAILDVELHVDHHSAVLLKIRGRISIQIQENREQQQLLIACMICEIPPGRFRENVLAEALKANASQEMRGSLGYLAMKNSLTLHQTYPMQLLDGNKLAALTSTFIEYAERWEKAIQKGQVGPI